VSKKRLSAPLQVLGFSLDELKEARLAPIVNFKGRAQDRHESLLAKSGAELNLN